jgi:hypothetical protein
MEKVILLKKEAVYGTDAAPTPAANAVLTRNFSRPDPVIVDKLDRNLDLPASGRRKSANSNRRTACSFEVELAGSGAAGTAPAWMELLEGCRMAPPVVTAGVKVEQGFAADSAALSSLTGHDWVAGERVRSLGSRGSFALDFTAAAYPFASLELTGTLPASPAVDYTAPGAAADLTRWKEPVEVNTANTDFTLDGYALILQQLRIATNINVSVSNLVGANFVQPGPRALTATIAGEAPLAAKNYYTMLDAGTEVVMQLVHGIVAGNIVQLDAAYAEILKISRAEDRERDKLIVTIEAGLNIRNGQDDLLITAK